MICCVRVTVEELGMERSGTQIDLASRKRHGTDHTWAWLTGILLLIAALAVNVLMGDSVAFPAG